MNGTRGVSWVEKREEEPQYNEILFEFTIVKCNNVHGYFLIKQKGSKRIRSMAITN